jgi:hypothetical protein
MKTDVSPTSIQAYHTAPLSKRRKEFMAMLTALGEACNLDIADKTGLPINVVTPAANWLAKHDYIEVAEVKTSRTGFKAKYWKIKNSPRKEQQPHEDDQGTPTLFGADEIAKAAPKQSYRPYTH